jgi:hypothetical protein
LAGAAVTSSLLGCGLAGDSSEAPAARRICDGSSEIRLAVAYSAGGQIAPFTSVLYELGSAFLYVDGTCHYWAAQPILSSTITHDWRPYREGALSSKEERQLHDAVGYDDVAADECASRVAPDASSEYIWDGGELHHCFDWNTSAHGALRKELFDAATAVTGPMRLQVGRGNSPPSGRVYEWPLDAPIDQYLIEHGETRSFRVDDAAAVRALRAFRERAIADVEAAPWYWSGVLAIGPREGDGSYVISLRDELPFEKPGSWLPVTATGATTDTEATSSSDVEGSPTQAQCDPWSNQASVARREVQDAAGRSCGDDGDCTIVDLGLSCLADCGSPSAVARAAVQALELEVQSLESENCVPFEERGCPQPIPLPCTPPSGEPVAVCGGGQCVLEFVPHP